MYILYGLCILIQYPLGLVLCTKTVFTGISLRTLGASLALEVHGLTQSVAVLGVITDNQLLESVEGTNFLL